MLNVFLFIISFTTLQATLYAEEWKPNHSPKSIPVEMFHIIDDTLDVSIWAKSPMLYNPTNMDIDHEGRFWVTEGVN